jgi:hypothetical protein
MSAHEEYAVPLMDIPPEKYSREELEIMWR